MTLRSAGHGSPRRHAGRDKSVCADGRARTDARIAPQHRGICIDRHPIFDGGVAFFTTQAVPAACGKRTERHALIEPDTVADDGRFPDNNTRAMVDEARRTDAGRRVNINSRAAVGDLRQQARQQRRTQTMQAVGKAIRRDRPKAGIGQNDLRLCGGGGILSQKGRQILLKQGANAGDIRKKRQTERATFFPILSHKRQKELHQQVIDLPDQRSGVRLRRIRRKKPRKQQQPQRLQQLPRGGHGCSAQRKRRVNGAPRAIVRANGRRDFFQFRHKPSSLGLNLLGGMFMEWEALIGSTPMYRIEENLLLKAEFTNLTGSVKDRPALEMVMEAEKRGVLRAGSTILAPTSGNMGISLAAVCARRGYRCIVIMPQSMSRERRQLIGAYGAEIVLTADAAGMSGAVAKARALAHQLPQSYVADQFEDSANAAAHYRTTGPEIRAQTRGCVDIFVAGVGTGGTITGTGRYLKEKDPHVRIVAVEPAGSPLLSSGRVGRHAIAGLGADFIPKLLDRSLLDEIVPVTDAQAVTATRALARQGLLVGISSGAAYHAAMRLAAEHTNKTVVALLPDSGDRYLTTELFYDTPSKKVPCT